MKSPRTSCRHICRLILSKNLAIHRVFLRFFAFIRRKTCSTIRTRRFHHRLLKRKRHVAKCFSLVIPRPVRRLVVGIRPPIQGKTDCHSPLRGFIPREGTRRAAVGACYFAMTGTGILQQAPSVSIWDSLFHFLQYVFVGHEHPLGHVGAQFF